MLLKELNLLNFESYINSKKNRFIFNPFHMDRFEKAKERIKLIPSLDESVVEQICIRLDSLYQELSNQESANSNMELAKTPSESERTRVEKRLGGFGFQKSQAWKEIVVRYGDTLSQNELLGIASIVSAKIGVKLDREAKRRKDVLIKWFDENLENIKPYLDFLALEDENGQVFSSKSFKSH